MNSDFRTEGGSAANLEWPKVFPGVLLARFAERFSDESAQGLPHSYRSDSAVFFAGRKELGAGQVWGELVRRSALGKEGGQSGELFQECAFVPRGEGVEEVLDTHASRARSGAGREAAEAFENQVRVDVWW